MVAPASPGRRARLRVPVSSGTGIPGAQQCVAKSRHLANTGLQRARQDVVERAPSLSLLSPCGGCPVWETARMRPSLTFTLTLYPDNYVVALPRAGKR